MRRETDLFFSAGVALAAGLHNKTASRHVTPHSAVSRTPQSAARRARSNQLDEMNARSGKTFGTELAVPRYRSRGGVGWVHEEDEKEEEGEREEEN